jgi:predicted transcriptional regulator
MRQHKALQLNRTPLAELWRHPLHTREFGSQITNVLRCLQLEAHGYQVTVTELVGWEHSMKNELILARKTDADRPSNRARARERLQQVLEELGLQTLQSRFAANGD